MEIKGVQYSDSQFFSYTPFISQFSHVQLFVNPRTTAHLASLSFTNSQSLPKLMSIKLVMPSNHLILCHLHLLLPSIFPSIQVFSNAKSQLFASGEVSASTSVLPMNTQGWSDGLVGSPCSPRDSQESSPTSQFKSINSLALSFLCSPTPTSIHDYWKNYSLDQTDLCWQSYVSAF